MAEWFRMELLTLWLDLSMAYFVTALAGDTCRS
ncbi:hypothetical protein MMUC44124_03005 [Mycolicibacterium mucogenicum DSM 44124]|nr:hypothetical protein MMUC44124_03005 [Mycolicibacterium mucogenicum DSM 44124]